MLITRLSIDQSPNSAMELGANGQGVCRRVKCISKLPNALRVAWTEILSSYRSNLGSRVGVEKVVNASMTAIVGFM